DFDFHLSLRDGSFLSLDGQPLVTDATGALHVTPERITINVLKGALDQSELRADGVVSWYGSTPHLSFSAVATDLQLDEGLYAALPPKARDAWDQVNPIGSIDARITY